MARWSKSDRARIELRRALVERMAARGCTLYEITEKLARLEIINPETAEPYSVATISRDLTEIEKRWREAAVEEREAARAKQVGELRAARRMAWDAGQLAEVRRNIELESKLLGTQAPQRQEITGSEGGPLEIKDKDGIRLAILSKLARIVEARDQKVSKQANE